MLQTSPPPPWAARILVADDDPAMRDFLTEVLKENGCDVVDACDGAEAARKLYLDDDPWTYELVITDYQMPRTNGLDLLSRIGPDGPAVILMSAFIDEIVSKRARRAGAQVLEKPFSAHQLLGMVRGLIGPL